MWERTETIARALRIIQMHGGTITAQAFGEAFFLTSRAKAKGRASAAGGMLGRLRAADYVEQLARSVYRLTPKGIALLSGQPWPPPAPPPPAPAPGPSSHHPPSGPRSRRRTQLRCLRLLPCRCGRPRVGGGRSDQPRGPRHPGLGLNPHPGASPERQRSPVGAPPERGPSLITA